MDVIHWNNEVTMEQFTDIKCVMLMNSKSNEIYSYFKKIVIVFPENWLNRNERTV